MKSPHRLRTDICSSERLVAPALDELDRVAVGVESKRQEAHLAVLRLLPPLHALGGEALVRGVEVVHEEANVAGQARPDVGVSWGPDE